MAIRSIVKSPVADSPNAYCCDRMCRVSVIRSVEGGSSSVAALLDMVRMRFVGAISLGIMSSWVMQKTNGPHYYFIVHLHKVV